mgnify:CR=1 FL=1
MGEEAAQSAEPDQGADSQNENDLYADFLDGVPHEIHEQVIPALKAQDAAVTKRFQSRAEQVKPYEELGIFDVEPEQVGAYLGLDQAMAAAREGDEEAKAAVYEWWDQVGDALEFYGSDSEGETGDVDVDDEDFDPYDRNALAKLVSEQVQQAVGPVAEHIQERETREQQESQLREAEQAIEAQISELQEANPNLDEDALTDVLTMAELFADTDNPVAAGFQKYQSIAGKGESSLFESKVNQPATPETSGRAASNAVTPTSANIRDLVQERLEQQESLT